MAIWEHKVSAFGPQALHRRQTAAVLLHGIVCSIRHSRRMPRAQAERAEMQCEILPTAWTLTSAFAELQGPPLMRVATSLGHDACSHAQRRARRLRRRVWRQRAGPPSRGHAAERAGAGCRVLSAAQARFQEESAAEGVTARVKDVPGCGKFVAAPLHASLAHSALRCTAWRSRTA